VESSCADSDADFKYGAGSSSSQRSLPPLYVREEHLSCEELPDWDQSRYEMIRIVQLAEDSQHAQIELHFDKVLSTEVAVKRFSRQRLCSSPEEFRARWGAEDLEDPWQEIYVASYLGQVGPSRVPG
ncbi:unnamed protein product, partial [Polarella glacialis]